MGYQEGFRQKMWNFIKGLLRIGADVGGDLQPKDILAKVGSEMERRKKLGIDDNPFVPNEYAVYLSREDHEELLPLLDGVETQISNRLLEKIQKRKYRLLSPIIALSIKDDSALKKNEVIVEAAFTRGKGGVSHGNLPLPEKQNPQQVRISEHSKPAHTKIIEETKTRILEGPKLRLEILEGENKGQVIHLHDGEFTFGRGKDALFLIRDAEDSISRVHFQISVNGGKMTVKDLNSTNGTKVNDSTVDETDVEEGDVIGAGRVLLKVV